MPCDLAKATQMVRNLLGLPRSQGAGPSTVLASASSWRKRDQKEPAEGSEDQTPE